MTTIVTGGAGFIGSEVVRQLAATGERVIVVDSLTYAGDRARLEGIRCDLFQVDVCDRNAIQDIFLRKAPDSLIHLAAETHVDRSLSDATDFVRTNCVGTQAILDAARTAGIRRIVNVSTDEVYGELGDVGEFREDSPLSPNSPYSASKAFADMLGRSYHRSYGLPVITVRPSNNYGPWQFPEKLLPVAILLAYTNRPVPLYGKGTNVREWLHVSDCARGIVRALEQGEPGQTYNLSSGRTLPNLEIVRRVLDILGRPHSLIEFVADRPGHDQRYACNSRKAATELGWLPKISIDEGLERTVQWTVEHLSWALPRLTLRA